MRYNIIGLLLSTIFCAIKTSLSTTLDTTNVTQDKLIVIKDEFQEARDALVQAHSKLVDCEHKWVAFKESYQTRKAMPEQVNPQESVNNTVMNDTNPTAENVEDMNSAITKEFFDAEQKRYELEWGKCKKAVSELKIEFMRLPEDYTCQRKASRKAKRRNTLN